MIDKNRQSDAYPKDHRKWMLEIAGDAGNVYPPADLYGVSDGTFFRYWTLAQNYHKTKNIYYAIEVYIKFVSTHHAPPAWVLDALCVGFKKHMTERGSKKRPDPAKLAKQMGVSGNASGKTNPFDDVSIYFERMGAMLDMHIALSIYEIPKRAAARAVLLKHENIKITSKTLVEYYNKKWLPLMLRSTKSDKESKEDFLEFNPKFSRSFPPKARLLFKK